MPNVPAIGFGAESGARPLSAETKVDAGGKRRMPRVIRPQRCELGVFLNLYARFKIQYILDFVEFQNCQAVSNEIRFENRSLSQIHNK